MISARPYFLVGSWWVQNLEIGTGRTSESRLSKSRSRRLPPVGVFSAAGAGVKTNLVFFKPNGAGVPGDKMVAALRQRGVMLAMMDGRIRACTHLDVTAAMIEETIGHVRDIVRGA